MKKLIWVLVIVLFSWNIWLTVKTVSSSNTTTTETETGEEVVVHNTIVNGYNTDITEIVANTVQYVVSIENESGAELSSGVVYKTEKLATYIVTTSEVSDVLSLKVRFDNNIVLDARLVGVDETADIAVLSTTPNFETESITLDDTTGVNAGEYGIVIGARSKETQSESVGFGVISSPAQLVLTDEETPAIVNVFTTDIEIEDDANGSPLVNLSGQMIGLVSSKLSAESETGLSTALAANDVFKSANQIIENGSVTRAYLGVTGKDVYDLPVYLKSNLNIALDVNNGVVVTSVQDGSPADTVGILENDVILEIDGTTVKDIEDLFNVLYSHAAGDQISLTIQRTGNQTTMEVTLQ